MSVVVKTSLSASGTPASGDGSASPAATAASTSAAAASAFSAATCRNARYWPSVSAIRSRHALVTSTDDSSLAAILAPSVAASSLVTSSSVLMPRLPLVPCPAGVGPPVVAPLRSSLARAFGCSCLPQDPRDREAALRRLRRLRQRLLLGQPRLDDVGPGDVDRRQRVVGGLDVGHVDGLDLTDVLEDGAELARETFQLVVGQGESSQAGEVGYLVSGDLHDCQA